MNKHKLVVVCKHDAQAECTCGRWSYVAPGRIRMDSVKFNFNEHLKGLKHVESQPWFRSKQEAMKAKRQQEIDGDENLEVIQEGRMEVPCGKRYPSYRWVDAWKIIRILDDKED